jgi:hypothetical protein
MHLCFVDNEWHAYIFSVATNASEAAAVQLEEEEDCTSEADHGDL